MERASRCGSGSGICSMPKAFVYTSGCLCRNIRFEALGPALNPHTCSCRMCHQPTGALTAVWVEFPRGSVARTGRGEAANTYRSSDYSSRAFCPECGSIFGAIDAKAQAALTV
ncbi:MAG: GFA family protein [Pseudomonadota bacterium]